MLDMYLVCFQDENDENHDYFVAAENPLQAFTLWRAEHKEETDHYLYQQGTTNVRVFPIPELPDVPGVIAWPHEHASDFPLNMDTLATKALEAEDSDGTPVAP
jgi:hypothetical protein